MKERTHTPNPKHLEGVWAKVSPVASQPDCCLSKVCPARPSQGAHLHQRQCLHPGPGRRPGGQSLTFPPGRSCAVLLSCHLLLGPGTSQRCPPSLCRFVLRFGRQECLAPASPLTGLADSTTGPRVSQSSVLQLTRNWGSVPVIPCVFLKTKPEETVFREVRETDCTLGHFLQGVRSWQQLQRALLGDMPVYLRVPSANTKALLKVCKMELKDSIHSMNCLKTPSPP